MATANICLADSNHRNHYCSLPDFQKYEEMGILLSLGPDGNFYWIYHRNFNTCFPLCSLWMRRCNQNADLASAFIFQCCSSGFNYNGFDSGKERTKRSRSVKNEKTELIKIFHARNQVEDQSW